MLLILIKHKYWPEKEKLLIISLFFVLCYSLLEELLGFLNMYLKNIFHCLNIIYLNVMLIYIKIELYITFCLLLNREVYSVAH